MPVPAITEADAGDAPGTVRTQFIPLHLEAPPKPAEGAACNGCGVCCLAEPCPLGMVVSRRLHGACAALTWDEGDGRYRCGVVERPQAYLPWLPEAAARRLALRWIASGDGCDASLEVVDPATAATPH